VLQYKIHKRERTTRDLLLVLLVDLKNTVDLNLNTADLNLNNKDLILLYADPIVCGSDLVCYICCRSDLVCCMNCRSELCMNCVFAK
jgi:hypothetical protein